MTPIAMKGGLDLRSATTASYPGSLYDCLNFEVALSNGYRRIDGYSRFDGREVPTSLSIYTFRAQYANGERGGAHGGLDGGIPFYIGFGLNSGVWPPADFDSLSVGDEVFYRAIEGFNSSVIDGGFVNHISFGAAVRGVIVEAPDFVNVTGTDIDDVDLTIRTGQVFIPRTPQTTDDTASFIPSQERRFYGRSVIHEGSNQGQASFKGATSFPYGTFFSDMLVTGPWGNYGAYNIDLQPIKEIDWTAYNASISGNYSLYRQQVKEFPSGYALGMHWVDNQLYAVAETKRFVAEDIDQAVLDLFEPRQWCYYTMSYMLSSSGLTGVTDNRSLIPLASNVIRQHAHLITVGSEIEILSPGLDPVRDDEGQEPIGSTIILLTEVTFEGLERELSASNLITTPGGYQGRVRAVFIGDDGLSGKCLVENITSTLNVGDVAQISTADLFVVTGIYGGSSSGNPLCTIGEIVSVESSAVIVRSTDGMGFQPINMGYEVGFNTGTNEPLTIYERPTDPTVTDEDTGFLEPNDAISFGESSGWNASSGDLFEAIQSDDADYASTSLGGSGQRTSFLIAQDLRIDIADLDAVRGIEVEIISEKNSGTAPLYLDEVGYYNPVTEEVNSVIVNREIDSKATFTVGGEDDTFSAGGTSDSELSSSLFRDRFFGLAIKFRTGSGGTFPVVPRVYRMRVKIHYTKGTDQVWIWNSKLSVDIGTAQIVHKRLQSGEWDGSGKGILSMRGELLPLEAGFDIRTLAGGLGSLIANIESGPTPCRLPGIHALDREKSKYQFLTSNFFASTELRAVYGANGAGPAFCFNENYFFFIRTGVNDEFAKPRHVGRLQDRLALSYVNGNIDLSSPGDPANFISFVDGFATTLGVGEKITGLLSLQGDALGVFTTGQIFAFQGAVNEDLQPTLISPSSGAIEYTVADMGLPVFCDFRGISTISTSEKYGDFERGRMSYNVEPWLSPRIQGSWRENDIDQRVAGIVMVRNKNQYRLIFKDGYVLTMTVTNEGPEFTIQEYRIKRTGEYVDGFLVPLDPSPPEWETVEEPVEILATCWGVTPEGRDRMFMSARNYPYVIELDNGVTFDGQTIDAFATLNLGSIGDQGKKKRLNTLHIYGRVRGVADLSHQAQMDYAIPSGKKTAFRLGNSSDSYYSGDRPAFTSSQVNVQGQEVLLRINHESSTDQPFTLQAYSWPDVSLRRMER